MYLLPGWGVSLDVQRTLRALRGVGPAQTACKALIFLQEMACNTAPWLEVCVESWAVC